MTELCPRKWELAKGIILGDDPERVSLKSAAKAAGMTLGQLTKWIDRSRERLISDDPWVWEIAEAVDFAGMAQAGTLEDAAWKRSVTGIEEDVYAGGEVVGTKVKYDNRLLEKMLKARDPKYIEKTHTTNVNINADIDMEALEARWNARLRMKEVEAEKVVAIQQGTADAAPAIDDLMADLPSLED